MEFDAYGLDPTYHDEMFLADGTPRGHCRELQGALRQLSAQDLQNVQERVTRSFSTEGITFTVYGDAEAEERIIPVDCIPRILAASDWQLLEAGLTQRLRALNHFLADIYNDARILNDGVIPPAMVHGCPPVSSPDARIPRSARHLGSDLRHGSGAHQRRIPGARGQPEGAFRGILHDCQPEGGQGVVSAPVPQFQRARGGALRARTADYPARAGAAPGATDSTLALLTPGVYNSAFYEHMFLAGELDAELVEGSDLLVVDGFVYMRTTTALRRVDVILPAGGRRLHRSARVPCRLVARGARTDGCMSAWQRDAGERSRHRRGGTTRASTPTCPT